VPAESCTDHPVSRRNWRNTFLYKLGITTTARIIMSTKTLDEHIEITPGVAGAKPRITGHPITVQDIVIWHERLGKPTRLPPNTASRRPTYTRRGPTTSTIVRRFFAATRIGAKMP